MSTLRTVGPSIASIFRFAAQPSASRRCARCLRAQSCPFSSSRLARQSSKRPLMTESAAYRPQTLSPDMAPPPTNAGTLETSVSGGGSELERAWPPKAPWERKNSGTGGGEREGEAQKIKGTAAPQQQPTTTEATATPQPKPTAKKSKFRPRKAAMNLSPKAVSQLRQLFEQPESKLIRVGVKNRGCSGLAYHLEYVERAGAFDEAVEQDGVRVLIDSRALFSIIGSEMDWVEDKLSARFVFRNPNITEQCGCGESFSIS